MFGFPELEEGECSAYISRFTVCFEETEGEAIGEGCKGNGSD